MLAYKVVGSGSHRLAFLHGLFGRGANFRTIATMLAKQCTSILIDLPNHGESEWTGSVDLNSWGDQVVELLGNLGVLGDELTLIGHSMGAKVAMYAALHHPQAFGSLVVEDMSPVTYQVDESLLLYIRAMKSLDLGRIRTRRDAAEILQRPVPDDTVRAFLLQNLRRGSDGWAWELNLDLLDAEVSHIGSWEEPSNTCYSSPVLWIGGENSNYVAPDYYSAMRRYFPNTYKVVVKGAGHWIHSEKPTEFTSTLKVFIDYLNTRTTA